MSIDAYFAGRPAADRSIFDRVAALIDELGGAEVEAVSVGVLFRARRTFVELRPRRRGLGVSVFLPRELASDRVSRRMRSGSGVAHVVPVLTAEEVDDELAGWIAESYEYCS